MIKSTRSWAKWIVKVSLCIAALGFAALISPASAQAQVSLFGGYSYFRASAPVGQFGPLGPGTPCPPNCGTPPTISKNADLRSGWELAGQYKFMPFLGVVADFSGHYGTLQGANLNVNTYMFGPQISSPGKISPFLHALFGVAHERQAVIPAGAFYSLGSDTSFATALGGGVDVKLVPFVALRLIQVDYLHTDWHGMSQGEPRLSAGIVLHF